MRLLIFGCFLILSSCYTNKRECSNYKVGDFKSMIEIDGTIYESTFSRTEDLQIETYNGVTDSSTVRWINDCEVVFKTINPKSMSEEKNIHLKIISTTDTSYTFEYSYVGDTKKQRGKAVKL